MSCREQPALESTTGAAGDSAAMPVMLSATAAVVVPYRKRVTFTCAREGHRERAGAKIGGGREGGGTVGKGMERTKVQLPTARCSGAAPCSGALQLRAGHRQEKGRWQQHQEKGRQQQQQRRKSLASAGQIPIEWHKLCRRHAAARCSHR